MNEHDHQATHLHEEVTVMEEEVSIVERSTLILLRFPCLDYFGNVHIGEAQGRADGTSRSEDLQGPSTAPQVLPATRKRPRSAASVQDGRRAAAAIASSSPAIYAFRPSDVMHFVRGTLQSDTPRLRMADVNSISTSSTHVANGEPGQFEGVKGEFPVPDASLAGACQEFEGSWLTPSDHFTNASGTRSNMAVVELLPEGRDLQDEGAMLARRGTPGEDTSAPSQRVPASSAAPPATLAEHPAEGTTLDGVYVRRRVRGAQRAGEAPGAVAGAAGTAGHSTRGTTAVPRMVEVTSAGSHKVPRWVYGQVMVPDAVLEMRRVR